MQPRTFDQGGCIMKEFRLIKTALKKHVIMHGARINFLACFIVGFLKTSTVNLKKSRDGNAGSGPQGLEIQKDTEISTRFRTGFIHDRRAYRFAGTERT